MKCLISFFVILFFSSITAQADYREAADYSADNKGVSMVVLKAGQLVFEDYPGRGGQNKAWELASGTKSFCAVIAAAAVQDGILTLDEKVAETISEWKHDSKKSKITIRQLLSITSGLKPNDVGRVPTYAKAIETPAIVEPGTKFDYGPTTFQVFGEVMRRKLEGQYPDVAAYLQARVLDQIGVTPAEWTRGKDGYPRLSMGVDLTARNWATFGEFVRRDGEWNGTQLIDAETLGETMIGSKVNRVYGLSWWLNKKPSLKNLRTSKTMRRATDLYTNRKEARKLPSDMYMAGGAGFQRLYIIPSMDLIIVRQSGAIFGPRSGKNFSDVAFLSLALDIK